MFVKDDIGKVLPNGGLILDYHNFPKHGCYAEGRVVLCFLSHNKCTPFVTWIENLQSGGCCHGEYYTKIYDAVMDFDKRCVEYDCKVERYLDVQSA